MDNPSIGIRAGGNRIDGTGRHHPVIEDYRNNLFTINAFILVIDAQSE
jgi:hypothetical protein